MGDTMILNEHEVKTCLVYGLTPILKKYSIEIKDIQLTIEDVIEVRAIITYQDRILDLCTSFTIGYKNKHLCFENITGTLEYLFLQLSVISVLQQLIHDDKFSFHGQSCYYACDLPINEFSIKDKQLYISLMD